MRPPVDLQSAADDLNVLANFLARRGVPNLASVRAEAAILFGNSLVETAVCAAEAWFLKAVPLVVVAGGVGHQTPFLRVNVARRYRRLTGDTEADLLAGVLERLGVPAGAILREKRSTNTGENVREAIRALGGPRESVLLIQDPTMQHRAHATARRQLPEARLTSFAPFVPFVSAVDGRLVLDPPAWPLERFVALALGEIPKLRDDAQGYGPRGRGYIAHVEIPTQVAGAYDRLANLAASLPNAKEAH